MICIFVNIINILEIMTEREKQQKGMLYQANDPEVLKDLYYCENECYEINQIPPSRREERMEVGENFFANTNCVILDEAKVTFGDNVFIAPNCSFYTAGHPLDVELRNKKIEYALPIHVGNNVWIGGNVVVVPGVTIGDNTTIGAGSVVTHDIPSGVVAAGNPCRVIRKLDE